MRDASHRDLSLSFLGPLVGVRKVGLSSVHRDSAHAPLGAVYLSGLHQRGFAPSVSSTGDDVRPMALLCWHTIVMALPLGALS